MLLNIPQYTGLCPLERTVQPPIAIVPGWETDLNWENSRRLRETRAQECRSRRVTIQASQKSRQTPPTSIYELPIYLFKWKNNTSELPTLLFNQEMHSTSSTSFGESIQYLNLKFFTSVRSKQMALPSPAHPISPVLSDSQPGEQQDGDTWL